MTGYIDFFFNELYPQQGLTGATYDKCISLFAENKSLTDIGYLLKLNNFLQCLKEGRNGDARAWGILTLCELAGEIVKIREQLPIRSTESNPLDIDLKIALNLPGENTEHDEIRWNAFGVGVEHTNIKTVDTEVLETFETSINNISNNPGFCPLGELNRLSSLYIRTLAMLSRI